jgi:hypothetical protein
MYVCLAAYREIEKKRGNYIYIPINPHHYSIPQAKKRKYKKTDKKEKEI